MVSELFEKYFSWSTSITSHEKKLHLNNGRVEGAITLGFFNLSRYWKCIHLSSKEKHRHTNQVKFKTWMRLGQKKNPVRKKVDDCINSPNKSFFKHLRINEPVKRSCRSERWSQAYVKWVLKEGEKPKPKWIFSLSVRCRETSGSS